MPHYEFDLDERTHHQTLVDKGRKKTFGHKKKSAKKRSPKRNQQKPEVAARIEALAKYTTGQLQNEIWRRIRVERRKAMTPEERQDRREKRKALRRQRKAVCDHTKKTPRPLRKSHKHYGKWYCPSCQQVIPKPRLATIEPELEIVT